MQLSASSIRSAMHIAAEEHPLEKKSPRNAINTRMQLPAPPARFKNHIPLRVQSLTNNTNSFDQAASHIALRFYASISGFSTSN